MALGEDRVDSRSQICDIQNIYINVICMPAALNKSYDKFYARDTVWLVFIKRVVIMCSNAVDIITRRQERRGDFIFNFCRKWNGFTEGGNVS